MDRDQTDVAVTGWNDLLDTREEVAFLDTPANVQMLIAAISYGLEGEGYTLAKAIELLASLHDNGRLLINSFESPILICFDYQAAALVEKGRTIEIIVPKEGTFTYEKGLLSNENLEFAGDINQLLLEAKLRLLNGKSDSSIYPVEKAYAPAIRVADYKHFATITQDGSRFIERNVLRAKRYMSVDNREHLYFALLYISIITLWVASIVRRSIQKGIGYAALFTGIILIAWALVRLIKYQVAEVPILTRYLWYSFYIFQLTLPLVMLWMAWAIDKPEHEIVPPRWWRNMMILIGMLIIFVFTNDLHGLMFHLDLTRSDWAIEYGYGLGYYTVLFVCMANLLAVFVVLMKKSIRNPRKKGFILPLAAFFMFGVYNYKYIVRDPFVYETDLTIITGIFTMLMFESCIRSGLIPVNTKYIDLFTRSPLKIQIINKEGEVELASASAKPIDKDVLDKVLASAPTPILRDDDSLLFANPIPGGYALWHEDISKISQLHEEILHSTQMLKEANAMLAEEEKIKRFIIEEEAKRLLMEQLESEIAESLEQLSTMIGRLPHSENQSKETTAIALLLAYIKGRCNLFFKEKETDVIDAGELIVYIEELSEIAKYSDVQFAILNEIKENIHIRYATLFYDFFYGVAHLAVQTNCPYTIVHIGTEDELLAMRILPSEDRTTFKPGPRLAVAIAAAKGNLVIKNVEEKIGISLSFPKGGVTRD